MEDDEGQGQGQQGQGQGQQGHGKSGEAVRSRWTPKPEQILILESIFNSGMVNPPKDETVRIRKLLEKFGSVGDANVFYWFQNRRSRSRRRQRQMQAATLQAATASAGHHDMYAPTTTTTTTTTTHTPTPTPTPTPHMDMNMNMNMNMNTSFINVAAPNPNTGFNVTALPSPSPSSFAPSNYIGCSSFGIGAGAMSNDDSLFSLSAAQLGYPDMDHRNPLFCPSDTSTHLHYQSGGYVTVLINGVATEVARGPLDLKAMFGEDVMLLHSSGLPLPINEFGFLLQSLQHGESYFLVSRQT